jgi:hypothetical protein
MAAVTAIALAQLAWLGMVGDLIEPVGGNSGIDLVAVLQRLFGDAYQKLVVQVIGVFGWLDTPAPAPVVGLWLLLTGGMAVLSLTERRLRRVGAVAVTMGLVAVTFVGFEILEVERLGYWQGRYSMPLLVGIPILLGLAITLPPNPVFGARLRWWVVGLFAVAHIMSFWQNLKRYTVGVSGTNRFLFEYLWTPPVSPAVLMLGYGVAVAMLGWWMTRRRPTFDSS